MLRTEVEQAEGAAALDLDALMERLRAEVEQRRSQASAGGAGGGQRYDAQALLDLPDAEFVATARRFILGREAGADEVGRDLDRLLLGRVSRTAFLQELMSSAEGRARGVPLEGLARAIRRERMRDGVVSRWLLNAAQVFRTIYLLPRRIRQFQKRVDLLERRAADVALRIEALERSLQAREASVVVGERDGRSE
jgi:hypothetical protein